MPNERISDMPDVGSVSNLVVLPIVTGGTNWKCTKQEFLTGNLGENIQLIASAGQFAGLINHSSTGWVFVGGSPQIQIKGTDIILQTSGSSPVILDFSTAGIVSFTMTGLTLEIGGNPNFCLVGNYTGAFGKWKIDSPGGVYVGYIVGNPASWSGFAPLDLASAVDRCAALLKTLNGGVGP